MKKSKRIVALLMLSGLLISGLIPIISPFLTKKAEGAVASIIGLAGEFIETQIYVASEIEPELKLYNDKAELVATLEPVDSEADEGGVEYTTLVKVRSAGTYFVVAEDENGSVVGQTIVKAVSPVLVTDTPFVTSGVNEKLLVRVENPLSGKLVTEGTLTIGTNNAEIVGGDHQVVPLGAAFDVQVRGIGDMPSLSFALNGVPVDGQIYIYQAIFVGSIDQGRINMHLTKADGSPLGGYTVYREGEVVGVTDEEGFLNCDYVAGNYYAQLDDPEVRVELRSKTVDAEPPVIHTEGIPKKTNEKTVSLRITDNERVAKVLVNGERWQDFTPGKEVTLTLPVRSGGNFYRVIAYDAQDNIAVADISIQGPFESIVDMYIGEAGYRLNGKFVPMVPSYLDGNTTMVPARMLEAFGAEFAWNGQNKIATFRLRGNTVRLTIGAAAAEVNGELVPITLPAAIRGDRTMIPLRFVSEKLGLFVHWQAGHITIKG